MFDYHMHSTVSFDGHNTALQMALSAKNAGLREICFTDHMDYTPQMDMVFDPEQYELAYDHLEIPGLQIRKGVEYGLTPDNCQQLHRDLLRRNYDYVLGSIHMVDGVDVYMEPFWQDKTPHQAALLHLEQTLKCVQVHTEYDVLGHLTFLSKARGNPTHALIPYDDYRDLFDQILTELVRHGKGLELNTSGIDRCGGPLPTLDYFRRFKELGGEIVTIGSDAHTADRVGQYTHEMVAQIKALFGYVCTFENRQPIFHK